MEKETVPEKLNSRNDNFLREFFFQSEKNNKLFQKTIGNSGISINGANFTENDTFAIPEELTISDKLLNQFIKNRLEVQNLKKIIPQVNECLHDAKNYLQNYLHLDLPKEIRNITKIKNNKELFSLLRKTKALKNTKNTFSPYYCALVSTMIVAWEYQKANLQDLTRESEYFRDQLFAKKNGIKHFHPTEHLDEEWDQIGILCKNNIWINADFSFRSKTKNSIISKGLRVPEFDGKDAIGLKFEVQNERDASKLIKFLAKYIKNIGATKIEFENTNFLSKNSLSRIKKAILHFVHLDEDQNPNTNKKFKSAKIIGRIKLPKKGKNGDLLVERGFEIQITPLNNGNENGLSHHAIYKNIQKLSIVSRLFGSFTEEYLDIICQKAHQESGVSTKKIKDSILANRIIQITKPNGNKKRFISKEQSERWQKLEIWPENVKLAT